MENNCNCEAKIDALTARMEEMMTAMASAVVHNSEMLDTLIGVGVMDPSQWTRLVAAENVLSEADLY